MGKFGPLYLPIKHSDLSFFIVFFQTNIGREKNCPITFFFRRITLILALQKKRFPPPIRFERRAGERLAGVLGLISVSVSRLTSRRQGKDS